jgi:hypothetical protein
MLCVFIAPASLFAIEQGYDLHSYSSFLIFGQKWLDAGGSAEPVENHLLKKLQTLEKSKTFRSLLYGTGVVSFSENSNVPTSEGKY